MDQSYIEIAILAFVAAFVLIRLYMTLGKRTGSERPAVRPQPVQGPFLQNDQQAKPSAFVAAGATGGEGLRAILKADPNFDVDRFVAGARAAYELIVTAFAKGDREELRNLLTPRVFETYVAAIAQREEKGEKGPELVRLRRAEITDASLEGGIARVQVKFEAELAEGEDGVRDAREKWTFERNTRSTDPNWLLARVVAA